MMLDNQSRFRRDSRGRFVLSKGGWKPVRPIRRGMSRVEQGIKRERKRLRGGGEI